MKNLNATEFKALLIDLNACDDAQRWAAGKSLSEVWATCHRGDWMLWLAARYGDVPRKTSVAIACDVAEPALKYTTDPRPAECLAVVRRWLEGEATLEEVKAAGAAADAAAAATRVADAAVGAAADAAWAASASAAASAADAAADAAREESLKFSADVCRRYIQVED